MQRPLDGLNRHHVATREEPTVRLKVVEPRDAANRQDTALFATDMGEQLAQLLHSGTGVRAGQRACARGLWRDEVNAEHAAGIGGIEGEAAKRPYRSKLGTCLVPPHAQRKRISPLNLRVTDPSDEVVP